MGMTWLLVTTIGIGLVADDPAELVEQLGASRYAERQKAAQSLLEMGREALPALQAGSKARDAEVRDQVRGLLEAIESKLLVEATEVTLDGGEGPLVDAVLELGRRSGMSVALFPENLPVWKDRKVTLEATGPVPFWTAVSRLCQAGGVYYQIMNDPGFGGQGATGLRFLAGGVEPGPTSDSGPFRATLVSVHHHRDLPLTARPGQGLIQRGAVSTRVMNGGQGLVEQFYVQMQLFAEPRLLLNLEGQPKVLEAVDDRGQSLLQDASPGVTNVRYYASYVGVPGNAAMTQVQLPLKYPDEPGKLIKRIKGTVSLSVAARRPEPIALKLGDAAGKSVRCTDLLLTVHDVKADPNGGHLLDLSIRPIDGPAEEAPGRPSNVFAYVNPESLRSRLEIVDAQGIVIPWYTQTAQTGAEGTRMTVKYVNNDGIGPPVEVRLHDLVRARTELNFEFQDVPMPVRAD
jgi:hypothetical protein